MYMTVYNKLVRDLIPAIVQSSGKIPVTTVLNDEDYIIEVKKKLHEELTEYEAAASNEEAVEELADLLELIQAAAVIHGASVEELEAIRKQKAEKRGGFGEKIFLVEVKDDEN